MVGGYGHLHVRKCQQSAEKLHFSNPFLLTLVARPHQMNRLKGLDKENTYDISTSSSQTLADLEAAKTSCAHCPIQST